MNRIEQAIAVIVGLLVLEAGFYRLMTNHAIRKNWRDYMRRE